MSTDLRDPSPSLSTTEGSPLIAKISPYTPLASLSTPLASPASPTSLDIKLLDCYLAVATAPESSSGTPAGMCITDDMFEEEERPSDESSDELSSSTGTMNLALATHYDRHSTVLTGRHQHSDPSPALSGSCAAYPSAINAAFWALVVSWFVTPLDDGTLAPPPSMLPPLLQSCRTVSGTVRIPFLSIATHQFMSDFHSPSPDSLVAIVGPYQLPRICDRLDSAEPPSAQPLCCSNRNVLDHSSITRSPIVPCHCPSMALGSVLDFCFSSCFAVTTVRQISPPQFLFVWSCRLPCFHRSPVSVFSLFITRVFSLLANDLFRPVSPRLLISRAVCTVEICIYLVFLVS